MQREIQNPPNPESRQTRRRRQVSIIERRERKRRNDREEKEEDEYQSSNIEEEEDNWWVTPIPIPVQYHDRCTMNKFIITSNILSMPPSNSTSNTSTNQTKQLVYQDDSIEGGGLLNCLKLGF